MKYPAYSKYKHSGVECLGEAPEHWELKKIRYLAILKSGENITSDQLEDEGEFPVFGGNGLRGYSSCYTHQGHYVLIGRQGALCGNINYATGKFWASEHAIVVSPLTEFATVWLGELLRSMNLNQYSISAAQPGLSVEMISGFKIPVPPVSEQRAIAAFLDRETAKIDALMAKKFRLIELLKEKRTALISHAVTKGLDPDAAMKPSGIDWLGEVPAHWEIKRLKYVVSEPLKYGANEASEMDDQNLPRYIRISDVDEEGRLRDDTFKSIPEELALPYLLKDGDLLLARSGATVGKSFYYEPSWGRAAYAGYLIRARFNPTKVLPRFINYYTNSYEYWQWLSSIFIQSTIQNVSAEKYASLPVPVPPFKEQQEIVQHLDVTQTMLSKLIDKVNVVINELIEYRSALVSAAVTGKIDVRHLAKEAKPSRE